jgi:hypothetical protein
LNAIELARNKFNALFADHDAKDIRAAAQEQKPAFEDNQEGSSEERQVTRKTLDCTS